MENDNPASQQVDMTATALAFFFPALGGLLFGYDIGATSGAAVSITSSTLSGTDWYSMTPFFAGLVVSGSLAGALAASALALVYGDKLGRKNELLLASGFYGAGALTMATASSLPALLIGRAVYGLGIGFAMHGAPMYVAETAPAHLRGSLISLKEAFIVGGILLGYLGASYFIDDIGGWRSIYGIAALPAVALALGMSTLPDSPRWLLLSGKGRTAAEAALTQLRGKAAEAGAVATEIADMARVAEVAGPNEGQEQKSTLAKLLDNKNAMYAGISLVVFQQITGQPSVLYYATEIFQRAGFASAAEASKVSVLLGGFKFAMTFVAVSTVDTLGRRPLLLYGVSAMVLSLLGLGGVQLLLDGATTSSAALSWGSVAALLLYVGAYQVSFGPVAWLIVGEVFPVEVRSAAVGCATLTNFGTNFLVSLALPSIQTTLGPAATYLVFAGLGVLSVSSIYYTLPETKGKTLEQIQDEFSKQTKE